MITLIMIMLIVINVINTMLCSSWSTPSTSWIDQECLCYFVVCCCCRLQLDYDPIMNGDWLNPSDSQMRLRPPTACMLSTLKLWMRRKLFLRLFRHCKCFQFLFHDSTKWGQASKYIALDWIFRKQTTEQPPTFVHCNCCCLSLHILSSSLKKWLRYLNPITKPNIPIMALTVLIECCGNTTQDSWVKSRAHRRILEKIFYTRLKHWEFYTNNM